MGNTLGSQRLDDLRSYLMDSPDIVVHSLLATYKLFKVFHCAHEGFKHGGVIVKLFIPNVPEEDDFQESVIRIESVLKPYKDATFLVQCRFWGLIHPNVVPYESAEILGKSAILMRQYFGRNLFDRIYTQPRLSKEHKMWFAIQILAALAQIHSVGLIHGDIKGENVFVVGSFQALLTDFATFIKPVYLPLDDPVAATSLFFESGVKRRRCFIAPERFIDSLTSRVLDEHGRRMTFFDKEFTLDFVRMDIFSCGLCIAELFLDGQHIVDLPELLAFRSGAFDLAAVLDRIPEPSVRSLVKRMTIRDPSARPESAGQCLKELLFQDGMPELFTLMTVASHPVYANADMRMMLMRHNWSDERAQDFDPVTELEIFDHCLHSSLLTRGVSASITPLVSWCKGGMIPHPTLSETACRNFCEKLLALWTQGAESHMTCSGDAWRASLMERINELYCGLFTSAADTSFSSSFSATMPLLASFLGATATACSWSKSKLVYIDLIHDLVVSHQAGLTDETISDLLVPYMHELASGSHDSAVKQAACGALTVLVPKLSRAETGLFSEYLFPLCLSLEDPIVVSLAAVLAGEAIRLSQPDEGGKKRQAIGMFISRVVTHACNKQWFSALAKNINIFQFVTDPPALLQQHLGELVSTAPLSFPENACLMPNALNWILHAMYDPLFASSVDVILALLNLLFQTLKSLRVNESSAQKAQLVTAIVSVLPLLSHWSFPVREEATIFLTRIDQLSPLDQFVFLRTYLPKGCRVLSDLHSYSSAPMKRSEYEEAVLKGIFTKHIRVENLKIEKLRVPPTRQESELSISSPGLVSHSISGNVGNPFFEAPRPIVAHTHTERRFSLRNFKDWKYIAAGYPSQPTDLGCLSSMDGSLRSIYSSAGLTASDLQARLISTYPCIHSTHQPSAAKSSWKPESLLLATLNDFCASGKSVSVVAIDSTDDGRVIAASGADGCVRVWRTNALETEAIVQPSKIIQVPACSKLYVSKCMRNSKSLIVGNDNSLIVYRLDSASIAAQSQSHPYGHVVAMDCFDTEFSSNILAVTEKGFLIDFDVRSNRFSSLFAIDPLSHSRASGVVVSKDASAFAVSSIAGNITIFDNRFLKPLKVWSVSSGVISTISHSAEPECVWVATGSDTCLFNLTHGGDPQHTLCINQTASHPAVIPSLSASNPATFSHNDVPICRSIRADSTSRCILEFPGSKNLGWNVLTGHNDGTVRHWTPKGDQTGIAFPLQIDPPITNVFGNVIAQSSFKDTEIEESPAVSGRLSTVTEGHRDAVNSVCVASLQCDIVATAGRDGLIKLWK